MDQEREDIVRAQERMRIAEHLKAVAQGLLCDPESDAIDGYVSAVIFDLAETIRKNANA